MILALDTSDFVTHACLRKQDGSYFPRTAQVEGNAEQLLSIIDGVYVEAGIGFEQTSGIVVCVGPGSFTGVRTGIATVQGLSSPRNLPVIGCSILLAAALWHYKQNELAEEQSYQIVRRANKAEFFVGNYRIKPTDSSDISPIVSSSDIATIDKHDLESIDNLGNTILLEVPSHRFPLEFDGVSENTALVLSSCVEVLRGIPHSIQNQITTGATGLKGLYAKALNAKTLKERGMR
jgi:tRNA threonylcarbamoyl adenosine modification protein YeaZ